MLGALLLLGTAVTAASQFYAGEAAEAASDQQAAILRQNAEITRQQGGQAEEALRRKQAMFFGRQRAAIAQSGVDPNSGSALDIQLQSEINAELDAMTLRYETELKALGLLSEAKATQEAGADARTAGYVGAGASVLTGIGSYGLMRGTQLNQAAAGV